MIILQSKKGTAQKYLQVMLNFVVIDRVDEPKHMPSTLLLIVFVKSSVADVNANIICCDWFK